MTNNKKRKVSARELKFCRAYAETGNAVLAALRAGYERERAEEAGAMLLSRDEILSEIGRLLDRRLKIARQQAFAGYERIAFGDVTDAVRLLFKGDDFDGDVSGYDLFHVAEIKRPKEGAMEIKFFDRLKALEKLEQYGQQERSGPSDFYQALVGGISRLKNSDGEGDASA